MKIPLLLALLPLSAFAGNDGPSADPAPMPHPPGAYTVISLSRACGLFCRNGEYSGLAIDSTGNVLYTKGDRDHRGAPALVATLAKDTLDRVLREVNSFKPQSLVDYDADRPACEDAGTATYSAKPVNQPLTTFAQQVDCHMHGFADRAGSDLVELLNGLEAVAQ